MNNTLKLVQTLEKPIHGYWDGGAKSRFEWTISGQPKRDEKGEYVRIGSWSANFWFHVSVGKDEHATLKKAEGYLRRHTHVRGSFSIEPLA